MIIPGAMRIYEYCQEIAVNGRLVSKFKQSSDYITLPYELGIALVQLSASVCNLSINHCCSQVVHLDAPVVFRMPLMKRLIIWGIHQLPGLATSFLTASTIIWTLELLAYLTLYNRATSVRRLKLLIPEGTLIGSIGRAQNTKKQLKFLHYYIMMKSYIEIHKIQ